MSAVNDQLQPGEEILYEAKPSKITLVPLALLIVSLLLAGGISWYRNGTLPVLFTALFFAGIATVVLLVRLVMLNTNDYILTNRRVIKQQGLIAKSSSTSYLDKINNVYHSQNLWGRLLGYGSVEVDTASETGMTLFPRIADPIRFKGAILEACETYRSNRFAPPAAAPALSGAEKIRQLKTLLDDGLINTEEFEAKRRKLLEEI